MKSPIKYFIAILIIACLNIFIACDKSTNPDDRYAFPDPIDSVANNITLKIHSCVNESLLATVMLETEGITTIDVPDTGTIVALGLNIFAEADGFYTKTYIRDDDDTLTVDLDAVPQAPNSITGVVFSVHSPSYSCYYDNQDITVTTSYGFYHVTKTDNQGRYGLGDLPPGDFVLHLPLADNPVTFEITNASGTDYSDFSYVEVGMIEAPYIYLYPDQVININVELEFTGDGIITESEPPYGNGWSVQATPNGKIDGQYDYLFYEGKTKNTPPLNSGWLVDGANLEDDITDLLTNMGFRENEIADFNEFWIPEILGYPYYAFFYVEPDSLVHLRITPTPDNIIRAFFVISPLAHAMQLTSPQLPSSFSRVGFTAVEWGVIGWHNNH
jgi:hypothetical protein